MKRKAPKEVLKPDFREKFSDYQRKVDELLDEYNVPKELIEKLAILDIEIEEEIDADMVELTDKAIIEILAKDEDLAGGVLYSLEDWVKDPEPIFTYLEICQPQFQYIRIESLNEQIKLDEFKAQLAENPYQLKIA